MTELFKNQYRTPSARLQSWDYGWNGYYFITICTKNRACYFGEILENKMQLSHIGVLAYVFWNEIKNHAENIILGEFVVMPNHIHGILILEKSDDDNGRDKACLVSTGLGTEQSVGQQRFQNQGKNTISSLVGGYKSTDSFMLTNVSNSILKLKLKMGESPKG